MDETFLAYQNIIYEFFIRLFFWKSLICIFLESDPDTYQIDLNYDSKLLLKFTM